MSGAIHHRRIDEVAGARFIKAVIVHCDAHCVWEDLWEESHIINGF